MVKKSLIIFAVFSTLLMLVSSTISQPVQENIAVSSFESSQESYLDSAEAINTQVEKDSAINFQLNVLKQDSELIKLEQNILYADSSTVITISIKNYLITLQGKNEYTQIVKIIEKKYSSQINSICETQSSDGISGITPF